MWTVKRTARFLELEPHQVYYLLVMGQIESVKIGKAWGVLPEAVEEYDKLHPERKNRSPAGHFVYQGGGGFLFRSLPDHLRLIRRGTMPAYKDGEGRWCILRSDLKTYCSRNSNL